LLLCSIVSCCKYHISYHHHEHHIRMPAEVMMPISALCCLSSVNQLSYLPKYSMRYDRMSTQFIQSFSKSCCKLMVQYEFRNMSAGFEKAGNQAQLKLLIARLLNVGMRDTDLCNVRTKVSRPVDGTSVTVERLDEHIHTHDIEESFRTKKPSILLGCIN